MLLDELLGAIELDVAPFAVCEIRRGWSVDMPPDGHTALHFVVAGSGTVRVGGDAPRVFAPGSVVVIPPGRPHRVDLLDPVPEPAHHSAHHLAPHVIDAAADCSIPEHGLKRLVAGEGAPGVVMVCGSMRATYAGAFGVFDGLDEPMVVDFEGDALVRGVFEGLLVEQAHPGPGSVAMMRAMMTQGIVALLRRMCAGDDCRVPWLAAVRDPQLSRALDRILRDPAQPHSLESIAKVAGMSRSTFAERFTRTFGRPAMDFVREVRLRRAADLLRQTDLPVATVAHRVGFQSRSSFSRAFVSQYGADPRSYRSGARSQP
jgi:AraC family transcriptional regulator, activator of mtrCDE